MRSPWSAAGDAELSREVGPGLSSLIGGQRRAETAVSPTEIDFSRWGGAWTAGLSSVRPWTSIRDDDDVHGPNSPEQPRRSGFKRAILVPARQFAIPQVEEEAFRHTTRSKLHPPTSAPGDTWNEGTTLLATQTRIVYVWRSSAPRSTKRCLQPTAGYSRLTPTYSSSFLICLWKWKTLFSVGTCMRPEMKASAASPSCMRPTIHASSNIALSNGSWMSS